MYTYAENKRSKGVFCIYVIIGRMRVRTFFLFFYPFWLNAKNVQVEAKQELLERRILLTLMSIKYRHWLIMKQGALQ